MPTGFSFPRTPPYSETPLAFAGLLAALGMLVENGRETAQRNEMLQVQTRVRLGTEVTGNLSVTGHDGGGKGACVGARQGWRSSSGPGVGSKRRRMEKTEAAVSVSASVSVTRQGWSRYLVMGLVVSGSTQDVYLVFSC